MSEGHFAIQGPSPIADAAAVCHQNAPAHRILDGELNPMKKADHIQESVDAARRDLLKMMGLFAAGTNFFWPEALFQKLAMADEQKSPAEGTTIGRREIIMGLDGMSRVATP